MTQRLAITMQCVHGDIRHLERYVCDYCLNIRVHGDIRHLESEFLESNRIMYVHGDIRHLENCKESY